MNNTPKVRNEVTSPESEKDLRKPLAAQQEIRLLDEFDAAHVVTFRIGKFIAAGSNVLCYEASRENAHRGTLREFYPADAFYLDRRPDGQLIFPDSIAPDMNMITRILRNCLHRSRDCRYLNCEELLRDLGEALCCVLPEELARKKRSGIPWTIAEADRLFDAEVDHRYTKDVQYHLYHHPLYEAMSPEDEELRVYIIGLDAYSRKFLDLTLQYAQDLRQQLSVTVFTDREEDRQKYLADRPALAGFFTVDGAAVKDSYGTITFKVMELERDNRVLNAKLMHRILSPLPADRLPQYVFIALGDDEINRNCAFACQKQLGKTTRASSPSPMPGRI